MARLPVDAAILATVPHRPPILRLCRLVAADGARAVALGQEPVGPGALPWAEGAIEGLAQTAALLLAQAPPDAGAAPAAGPRRGMLVAVKRAEWPAAPAPDAVITYAVELVRRLGPNALLRGEASADGVVLARAELTLWTAPG